MDIKEIHALIRLVDKSSVDELHLNKDSVSLKIKKNKGFVAQQMPVLQPTTISPNIPSEEENNKLLQVQQEIPKKELSSDESKYIQIKSPMIGTFYRRPSPEKPEFVKVGDVISSGQVICIIEAMKLFNEIESEVSGVIAKILVEDATPVGYDQPLYLVEPT